MAYRVVDVAEFEGRRKPLRRALESSAFALNQFNSPPGFEGLEHDERESGQSEVYVALAGAGVLRVGEEEVALTPGTYVLVSPEETRRVIAGEGGVSYLVVGGLGGTFE